MSKFFTVRPTSYAKLEMFYEFKIGKNSRDFFYE